MRTYLADCRRKQKQEAAATFHRANTFLDSFSAGQQPRRNLLPVLMRIALCLEYPIALRGGVSVLVEELLENYVRRGHQVVLVSADTAETLEAAPAGKLVAEHFHWNRLNPSAAAGKKLARQLAGARVDLAHFHFGGNYGWGNRIPFRCPIYHLNRLGVPCVSTVHSVVGILEGYCGPQKPTWFKALMFPLAWCGKMQQLRHTRREIAVSQHDLQKLQSWYRPLQNHFTQIYHSRLRDELAMSTNTGREPVILNVGHLAWRKGQMVLAEAFAQIAGRHPEWMLQLAGEDLDGTTEKQILQLARDRRLEERIQLVGQRSDAFALMRHAAIYVQPSFEEALGLALQEAMFHGCACIGSRVGGIPELIDAGRTGLLFEPGNVAQLAHALEQLIQDANQRNHFGHAAAASIREKNMTIEGMARRHLEIYETIAKRS
jgi:glycosyltransferase involved in cell wall biosynthesis